MDADSVVQASTSIQADDNASEKAEIPISASVSSDKFKLSITMLAISCRELCYQKN